MTSASRSAAPSTGANTDPIGLLGGALPFKAGLFDPSDAEPFGPPYDSVGLECVSEPQAIEIAKHWAATDGERREGAWLLVFHHGHVVASFPPRTY